MLMLHPRFCQRLTKEMGQSLLNSNGLERERLPIVPDSIQQRRQGNAVPAHQLIPNCRAEIVRWVSENKRPFAIVKDRGFQSLMKTERPDYHIPLPENLSRDVKNVFVHVCK
jgi:hypothetical protein